MRTQTTLTPSQVERVLARGFAAFAHTDPTRTELAAARAAFREIRARYGFREDGFIFSETIAKTEKNRRRTLALSLLPHDHSGRANLCPFEDQCARTCVAYSGKGRAPGVPTSRLARVDFMIDHPQHFAALLIHEIGTAYRSGDALAVRLNAYSDLRWERIAPWLFDKYPRARFYDYTKHPLRSRPAESLPTNYRLTYSASPRTTTEEFTRAMENGRNVAVVFPQRANTANNKLPRYLAGHRVIDGDKTDERYRDPVAVVVGLRRKGSLKAADALAQVAARLEDDHQ